MGMDHTVSAIVPAHNEEKNIRNILTTLTQSSYVDEVICINDGSTDQTGDIIRQVQNVTTIHLLKNHGKAYAVAKGVEKARGNIVLLVDADIKGFSDQSIKKLVYPLKRGTHDIAIGYLAHLEELFFRSLTGERAYFRKDLFPHLSKFKDKGYGLELYLNYAFRHKRIKVFLLKGVKNTFRHKKQSLNTVVRLDVRSAYDIGAEIFRHKNPLSYLVGSYLHHFYLKRPELVDVAKKRNVIALFASLLIVFSALLLLYGFTNTPLSSAYRRYQQMVVSKVRQSASEAALPLLGK